MPDRSACLAAVASRDARFDGAFFTGVTSTGIYCRPSCPARTPAPQHCTFHPSAAAAQAAGFRACKRCRPDAVPGSADWEPRADATARAVRLIADGVVDRDGVEGLARHLGYSPRQVERLTRAELGASPVGLARVQRAHTARLLLQTTHLPLADVAFAAGFGSIRSFNETVRAVYGSTPSDLRGRPATAPTGTGMLRVDLRLAFRRPFEPTNVFGHLAATAPCPVVIVPATWQPGSVSGHPVVALVGDHPVPATLAAAIAEANRLGTGLLALHLVRDTVPAADVEQKQRDLAAAADQGDHPAVPVETRVVRGNPHDHLIHESVNAAAAVVGRPHHHGTTGWMRSVAHAVMKRTHCPLIIVPGR